MLSSCYINMWMDYPSIKGEKQKTVKYPQKHVLSHMSTPDILFRAKIVYMILSKDTEDALELLSQHYEVQEPKLRVGMPKRYSKNPACYVGKSRTIHVAQRNVLWNPFVILHEFYHHLRRETDEHGGIEKYADKFAKNFIEAYKQTTEQT